MRSAKESLKLSELKALIQARRGAGASFAELGISASHVSYPYGAAVRRIAAQRLREADGERIDLLNQK